MRGTDVMLMQAHARGRRTVLSGWTQGAKGWRLRVTNKGTAKGRAKRGRDSVPAGLRPHYCIQYPRQTSSRPRSGGPNTFARSSLRLCRLRYRQLIGDTWRWTGPAHNATDPIRHDRCPSHRPAIPVLMPAVSSDRRSSNVRILLCD